MLVLPMDIDQTASQFPDKRNIHCLSIYPADAAPVLVFPGNDDLVILHRDLHLFHFFQDILVLCGKVQFYQSIVGSLRQIIFEAAGSHGHVHRSDHDGFARSGLTGENIQPRSEFHFCILY